MPNLNPSLFGEWGKQASKSYLTTGSSLNQEIAKLAVENDLNPAQIKRVCENANLQTYGTLFFTSRDKALGFDIATPEKVAAEIEKIDLGSKSPDYLTPPKLQKTAKSHKDINRIFGVESISNEHEVHGKMKIAEKFSRKLKASQQEMQQRLYTTIMEKEASEKRLYHITKQMVLRGYEFKKIAAVVIDCAAKKDFKPIMADIYKQLCNEGAFGVREKVAQQEPSDIIQEAVDSDQALAKKNGAPAVVNNKHPLVQEVNTLQDKLLSEDTLRQGIWLLKDSANVVKGKIKDLTGSVQRDKYVKEMLNEDDSPTKTYEVATHSPG